MISLSWNFNNRISKSNAPINGSDQLSNSCVSHTCRPIALSTIAFSIDKSDGSNLDRAEGYGHGYDKKEIDVEALEDGKVLRVWVYYATEIDSELKPYCWYKKQVVQGARESGLPEDYIKKIEAKFPCIQDRDQDRVAKNEKYLS